MPYKDPEKRREAVRKSCKKAYWANPDKARAEALEYRNAHRDEVNAKQRARRLANPELFRARSNAWREAHPESRAATRRKQMLKRHGLTLADYDRMHATQQGLCMICGDPETSVKCGKVQLLSVEHCHVTGRVRGLTCNRCNRGMGLFADNPDLLRAAAAYLDGAVG